MSKALIHEEVENPRFTNRLPLPSHAANDQIHYFINRKEDRFTFSGRYLAGGVNGKLFSPFLLL
jgi:hypothetical protein